MRSALVAGASLVLAIWGAYLFFLVWPGAEPGLIPRSPIGLLGILAMPLIHGSWGHLWANTFPLAVFSGLVARRGYVYFAKVTVFCWVLGGALLWCLGRSGMHVGASLLVFAYFGFLLARGYFEGHTESILVAIAVIIVYGGLFWGVLPSRYPQTGISWEGHLYGLIAGLLTARRLHSIKGG